MKKKNLLTIFVSMLLMCAILLQGTIEAEDMATLYVGPSTSYAMVDDTFTINITVADVEELCLWEIRIKYNTTILNCTSAWIPTDHVFKGAEDAGLTIVAPPPYIWGDYILYGCTFIEYGQWSFNGTGVLCQISFTGLAEGNSSLEFRLTPQPGETFLLTWNGTALEDIDFTALDGVAEVGASLVGDLNGDGIVDTKDVGIACAAFGSYPGHPSWNPDADINGDGWVDMRDIGIICVNYGKTI